MKQRYRSEEQIIKAIDRAHERLAKYGVLHDVTQEQIRKSIKEGSSSAFIGDQKLTVEKCVRNMNRIRNQVLPHLGEKLSEFRTMMLPLESKMDYSIPM